MNASSIAGRILPSLVTNQLGIINVTVFYITAMATLLFSLLGVKSAAGVMSFAVIYGFFVGGCKYFEVSARQPLF